MSMRGWVVGMIPESGGRGQKGFDEEGGGKVGRWATERA